MLTIPSIANSDLPGLLGLQSLRKNRAVLDFTTLRLHFCGPGDNEMEKSLPPGTDSFQLELAPSGHLVLPCCEYGDVQKTDTDYSLTLVAKTNLGSRGSQEAEALGGQASSSGAGGSQNVEAGPRARRGPGGGQEAETGSSGRRIPPAPANPPRVHHREKPVGAPPAGHA